MNDKKDRDFRTLSDRVSEEEYFYQKDLELVSRMRRDLDRARHRMSQEQQKADHWLRCPKCGSQLIERRQGSVVVDVCLGCGGLYLDKGELELILKMNKKDSFVDHLAHWLDRIFTRGFNLPDRERGRKEKN